MSVIYSLDDGQEVRVYGDFHTHSIYSLHAMSSPTEMVKKAKEIGMNFIAVTDHIYDYSDKFENLNQMCRPREIRERFKNNCGANKIIGGGEFNLFSDNETITQEGLHLLGLHSWWRAPGSITPSELIMEYNRMVNKYRIDIFVHPERYLMDYFGDMKVCRVVISEIVSIAHDHDIPIEINTGSITYSTPNDRSIQLTNLMNELLLCCSRQNCRIVLGSDAHMDKEIGQRFNFYLNRINDYGLLGNTINIDWDKCDQLYNIAEQN